MAQFQNNVDQVQNNVGQVQNNVGQVENNNEFMQQKLILHNALDQLIDNLPDEFTLLPIGFHQMAVIVEFRCPIKNTGGQTLIVPPNDQGIMRILSSLDRFNGYFIDVEAHNLEQIINIIQFTQELLLYQPDEDDLEHVRVPNHMLDHWCIPPNYRNFVLNGYE